MFPFDQQICRLYVESCKLIHFITDDIVTDGYPDSEVVYEWAMQAVQWDRNKIKLPDFTLDNVLVNETLGLYTTGELLCLFDKALQATTRASSAASSSRARRASASCS